MTAIVAALASVASLIVCLSAILISTDPFLFLAALFGAGILMAVLAIRSWRLGPLGQAGIAALAAVAVFGFFAAVPAKKDADPTLALSTQGQISSIERMLSDAKWGDQAPDHSKLSCPSIETPRIRSKFPLIDPGYLGVSAPDIRELAAPRT